MFPNLYPRQRSAEIQGGNIPLWMLFPLFFVGVYLSHWTLLRLPYFWDEAGYYIPAALDFFRTGTLIPVTTLTNAHPPLPSVLLAGWWHLSGFVVSGTRTFVCMVAASALLAIYRIGRDLSGALTGVATALLTAVYPVWFAQSTLAHADIFAASFTLWALSFYLSGARRFSHRGSCAGAAALFTAAALSKETAIITSVILAGLEFLLLLRSAHRTSSAPSGEVRLHLLWAASLLSPIVPLLAWYAYHKYRTGFVFGNPEFLRYNATANLDWHRIALSLWHRLLHLTMHMNMFVPVLCAAAAILMPTLPQRASYALGRPVVLRIVIVLLANTVAFSVLGGALLTRYLLPLYPLLLLICVTIWQTHVRYWAAPAALSFAAFLAAIFINPPYPFAPEDNLTYRDMVVLHAQAITYINQHFPNATVLSAWPATSELERPELGYTRKPIRTEAIQDFSQPEIVKAAAGRGSYDTALLFSTKWAPPEGEANLGKRNEAVNTRYFDFHHDLSPAATAALLGGTIVWQDHRRGEWAAVLRFSRP